MVPLDPSPQSTLPDVIPTPSEIPTTNRCVLPSTPCRLCARNVNACDCDFEEPPASVNVTTTTPPLAAAYRCEPVTITELPDATTTPAPTTPSPQSTTAVKSAASTEAK